jgi:hypothetical protein
VLVAYDVDDTLAVAHPPPPSRDVAPYVSRALGTPTNGTDLLLEADAIAVDGAAMSSSVTREC